VAAELPVEVTIIGDPDFEMDDVPNLQVAPWRLATERQDVGSFDIGIMPMPDNAWTRGKCGFKALLYMALGVATVASPVGVNPEIISHGVNGLLANDETQWVEALTHLAMDGALRGQLGTAGRDTVESRYSALAWAPVFHQALISVANGAN
jgi:hypothetical protein